MAEEKKVAAKKATKKAEAVEEVKAPVEEAPKKAKKAKKEEKKPEAPKKPMPTEARAIANPHPAPPEDPGGRSGGAAPST